MSDNQCDRSARPDNSAAERVEVEPVPSLVFRCPSCNGLTVAQGLKHVVAVHQGMRIDTACSRCKQPIALGRVEPPRVVPANLVPTGPNRQQRRAAGSRGRHGPLIVT